MGVNTFLKDIRPKVNVIARLEFELAYYNISGGARGVIVIVVGNRHGDTSSNPGPD